MAAIKHAKVALLLAFGWIAGVQGNVSLRGADQVVETQRKLATVEDTSTDIPLIAAILCMILFLRLLTRVFCESIFTDIDREIRFLQRQEEFQKKKNQRLSETERESLTECVILDDESECKEAADPCSICIDGFESGDDCRRLPCGHLFHKECIDEWFDRSSQCPLCKHKLKESEDDEEEKIEIGHTNVSTITVQVKPQEELEQPNEDIDDYTDDESECDLDESVGTSQQP